MNPTRIPVALSAGALVLANGLAPHCCAGVWAEVAKLTADDGVADDHFGYSIDLSVTVGNLESWLVWLSR
jgi:hypothetical protein